MKTKNFTINFIVVLGGDLVRSSEHLGVAYLTALLRGNGYQVYIDEYCHPSELEALISLLRERDVRLIGFVTTVINIQQVLDLSRSLKKAFPHVIVVYGGHVATFKDEKVLFEFPELDILVRGEGEETILELIQVLETQGDLASVNGIVYRDHVTGQIVKNPDRNPIPDLDRLPFPVRDQFERHSDEYHYIRICTSRGCYGSCSFCSNYVGRNLGLRWRGRSPDNVVDEIEFLIEKYNFHTFDFIDSTFEDPPGEAGKTRIRLIAEEIIKRNLTIYYNCCLRSENWTDADHELLDLLVKSGLEKVNVGLEAGNDRGLKVFGKRATVADNRRLIHVFSQHPEIYLTYGFIFFHPYQNFEDIEDNARFLFESGLGQVTRRYLCSLQVYPGTKIRSRLIADNLYDQSGIVEDFYAYSFINPEVGRFARKMGAFLEEDMIWDFEIFDIVIHTYIFRLLRHFGDNAIVRNLVEEFLDWVKRYRSEIAEANFTFFSRWIKACKGGWEKHLVDEAERFDIVEYLTEQKKTIQAKQLRLSMALRREGVSLSGIAR